MPPVVINSERIFDALTSSEYPPAAVEAGSELIDAWVSECAQHDAEYKTLLLEAGFFLQLDEFTYLVGAVDKVMQDGAGVLASEMKTTSKSKTWTAERWFDSLVDGWQLGTYAAALRDGTFVSKGDEGVILEWSPRVAAPRILVRAVTKSKPPEIWPCPEGQIVEVPAERIEVTLNAYRNTAAAVRAMRQTGAVPWQLPGKHCEKSYGFKTYTCEFHRECATGRYPTVSQRSDDSGLSLGSKKVLTFLAETGRVVLDDPRYVVMSSSSLEDFAQCPERWRRRSLGQPREDKDSLDVGSVFHLAAHEYHRQLQEQGF